MRSSPAAQSPRALRVGELIRHALAETLARGEIHDPAFEGTLVTVAEVKMSPDLKLATAYVAPLGGRGGDALLEAFERNRKYLRGVIARRVNLRYAPDIRFRLDQSFEEGERIDALLRQPLVKRDIGRDPDPEAESSL